jgi:hypothetical protein
LPTIRVASPVGRMRMRNTNRAYLCPIVQMSFARFCVARRATNCPAYSALIPVCSSCSIRATERLMAYSPLLVDAIPLTLEEIFIYELGGADYAVKDIVL